MRKGMKVMLRKYSQYYNQSKGGIGVLGNRFISNTLDTYWWYIQWDHLKANYPERDILIIDFNK